MGKKTAICVGINYAGFGGELAGCINDSNNWHDKAHDRGYVVHQLNERDAVRDNILKELKAVVDAARSGDKVLLTVSGHGTKVRDLNGDEPDGVDEAICPYDVFKTGAIITDDELATIFQDRDRGVQVVFISDTCHSGTVARFMAPPMAVDPKTPRVRFLPPENIPLLPKELQPVAGAVRSLAARGLPLKSTALLLGGCLDPEYSYDAYINGQAQGAFSWAALDALKGMPGAAATYRQWYQAIRKRLPTSQYPQTPSFVGTSTQKGWKLL